MIYIRENEYWNLYGVFKVGKTINILDRESTYITSEIKKGTYKMVIGINLDILDDVEKLIQKRFKSLNVKIDAGTEFYKKEIINLIIPYLDEIGIYYKVLTCEEIEQLVRTPQENIKQSYDSSDLEPEDLLPDLEPEDQTGEPDDLTTDNLNNVEPSTADLSIDDLLDRLKLTADLKPEDSINDNLTCNTLVPRQYQTEIINTAINYFQDHDKGLLVIPCGVGKTLISLWIAQRLSFKTMLIGVPNLLLLKQWKSVVSQLFQDIPCLLVYSKTTDIQISERCIIITTYASSYKLLSYDFDIIINDEAHHLTSDSIVQEMRQFVKILNIKSNKQLSLTATIKQLDAINAVSNDNINYFGEIIEKRCLIWAINENIVCDYVIQTIIQTDLTMQDNELYLSAFASIKSIIDGNSHHLLIYSNNKTNAIKIINYITTLLSEQFTLPDLYYSHYTSDIKSQDQKIILDSFEKAKFGIISCVYCLGEGWDFPILDGVVFAENMSSNIRIVQSALRPCRKNINEPGKVAKIILPIVTDLTDDGDSMTKVKEVIYQMGLEDETICQKIKVFKLSNETNARLRITESYDEHLTQMIKLKTIKRTDITYLKAKKLIVNIKTKKDYYQLCEIDNRLPKDPETTFKDQFLGWVDYLSIPREYYDLDTCKDKTHEYFVKYPELKKCLLEPIDICKKLCELDPMFPPYDLWEDYYKNIIYNIFVTPDKKRRPSV